MFSLSTKIRYATRTLIDIALHSMGKPIPLHEISERQGISLKYLEGIATGLKSAGLLTGVKGPAGGYLLGRPAEKITLFDTISAFGGPVALVGCVSDSSSCERSSSCAAYEAWREISDLINKKLGSISISQLAARQREKEKSGEALVYYI